MIAGISEADADERYAKSLRAQEIAREEVELEEARIQQFIAIRKLPKTHAEYRTHCADRMRAIIAVHRASFGPDEWSGYSVDDETLVVFDSIAEQLMDRLEDAGTTYSDERQQTRIREIRAMPLKANAPLQTFLRSLESASSKYQIAAPSPTGRKPGYLARLVRLPNEAREDAMPTISLTGDWFEDSTTIRALMLWPTDEDRRQQLRAFRIWSKRLGGVRRDAEVMCTFADIEALLEAPSQKEFKAEEARIAKRGMTAGWYLFLLQFMDTNSSALPATGAAGGSQKKVLHVLERFAKGDADYAGRPLHAGRPVWEDESAFSMSDRKVQVDWKAWKTVAHLWAAVGFLETLEDKKRDGPRRDGYFSKDRFAELLGVAASFQDYGQQRMVPDGLGGEFVVLDDAWMLVQTVRRLPIALPTRRRQLVAARLSNFLLDYRHIDRG